MKYSQKFKKNKEKDEISYELEEKDALLCESIDNLANEFKKMRLSK